MKSHRFTSLLQLLESGLWIWDPDCRSHFTSWFDRDWGRSIETKMFAVLCVPFSLSLFLFIYFFFFSCRRSTASRCPAASWVILSGTKASRCLSPMQRTSTWRKWYVCQEIGLHLKTFLQKCRKCVATLLLHFVLFRCKRSSDKSPSCKTSFWKMMTKSMQWVNISRMFDRNCSTPRCRVVLSLILVAHEERGC